MDIKIFIRAFPPDFIGGGEISTCQVAEQLKRKHTIEIYSLSSPGGVDFPFHHLDAPKGFTEMFPRLYTHRIKAINNLRADNHILWCADYFGALATFGLKNKKIVTVRDYLPVCPGGTATLCDYSFCEQCTFHTLSHCLRIKEAPLVRKIIRYIRYSFYSRFNPKLFSDAHHVVFISKHLAGTIAKKIPVKSYSIIYNPVDEQYISKPLNKGISKKLLFAGNVKEYKGMDVLLKTMATAINKDDRLRLSVAGDGDIEKYKCRARSLGMEKHITFLGKVSLDNMMGLYDEADCIIAPAIWPEPFGRTIIEGMARKCIPIASNHGGPPEIIKNGQNGYLCRPNDHEHFAEAIVSLYRNKLRREKMQDAARTETVARFSPSKIAKEYEKLFLGSAQ